MAEPICTAPELLSALDSRENLFSFLRSKLSWNVDPDDTFTYNTPEAAGHAAAHAALSRILPFSSGDPFVIFLVEFKERFRRGDLREILRGIRRDIRERAAYQTSTYKSTNFEDLVFVCTVPDGLRFVHFEERENRQPKLRLFGFDRDTVGETYTLRTLNLPSIRLTTNLLGEVDWNACKSNWKAAWDVERVTKLFYRDYRDVFFDVEANHVKNAPGDKRLFVQRFFNRLMFLHFLSKKGWLRAPGKAEGDTGREYLHDLWNEYQKRANPRDGETFYRRHLAPLFFAALNEPHTGRDKSWLAPLIGAVPYLNGGLFEQIDDDKATFTIEDAAFTKIWENLFACYNFTVAESTPDDQDVAVDPEMLGKVFEELVTGRHESGSYYTPRPVVQFMCREALKGYLAPCGSGVEKLVDFHDPREITNDEAVLTALKSVKIVDPACGSGAYLLGMLQELMALRLALFNKDAKSLDAKTTYERKLEIIQNCLYGVDLDPFAVNTARLRLWLSLVVEDGRNALAPDAQTSKLPEVALPNLDFKIEIGDSVSCPDPTGGLQQDMFRQSDLRVLGELQHRHGDVRYAGNKAALKAEIDALARNIKKQSGLNETAFDWRVDFGGVFQNQEAGLNLGGGLDLGVVSTKKTGTLSYAPEPGGFDIVLTNPPYVRGELIKNLKPTLKRVYGDARFGGTMDLYCFFYFRAIELLKNGGQLVFITPNKWFRAGYGAKLRETIAQTCQVRSITDFGELPVFETAATFPMIFVAQKGRGYNGEATFTQVKTLNAPYPDVKAVIAASGFALPANAIRGKEWSLTASHVSDRLRQMERAGIPLGEYVGGKIYRGILTGFNNAFVIKGVTRDELIAADPNSADLIKPLAVGDDIRRWRIENQTQNQKYIIVTKIGVPIAKYPAIFKHLSQWKTELESRYDKGKFWWELRACGYWDVFEKPKIVYPQICLEPRFTFDQDCIYTNQKCFVIDTTDLFLLGLLNSAAVWWYLTTVSVTMGDIEKRGRLEPRREDIMSITVPNADADQKAEIAALVQQCLDKRGQDVAALEAQINEKVAALYFT